MVFHKSQNQENIGLSFITWVSLLKSKLMTEYLWIPTAEKYSQPHKKNIKNGLLSLQKHFLNILLLLGQIKRFQEVA